MDDSDQFVDLDVELLENQFNDNNDDFDDDFDVNELVEVAETVEQQHAATTTSFFLLPAQDPTPPPLLAETTPCPHPFSPKELQTWIYPINYPVRAYQLNIVQKAMFQNTLVALPTGLGKTFIAAVVMFNYWRWFPTSKIIFMAHTRPLVAQQIEACFNICGIPQEETTDITGTIQPPKRRELWKTKRVFFATPQTVQKDIESNSCPVEKVCCLVIDEAHKATGNYAFTEVVRKIYKKNKEFRILALTATPGSTLDAVQDVINNLHITNVQIRTEESMDIREYSFGKQVEHRVVRLGYTEGATGILPRVIADVRTKIFEPLLLDLSRKPTGVSPSVDRTTTYGLLNARTHFCLSAKNLSSGLKFAITQQFLVTETVSRAYDLLCQHGIQPFIESIENTFAEYQTKMSQGNTLKKAQLALYNDPTLKAILRNLKIEMTKPDFIGHPKLEQLTSILLDHFTSLEEEEMKHSKVMIFSSFRSSVMDICNVLNRHQPIIRCSFFVGQASDKSGAKGLKQSEQQNVIRKFKNNEFNVLACTSIGEEGLDIGEVDLIICFDSQTSPIRMLQRMGRTGRKRKGRCILLLTEAEEKKFAQAKESYARIQSLITRGGLLQYYRPNPTVLPANYKPTLCRKTLEVGTYQPINNNNKKRKRTTTSDSNYTADGLLKTDTEKSFLQSFNSLDRTFRDLEQVKDRYWPVQKMMYSIGRYVPVQSRLQPTYRVGHSKRTLQLVRMVQKIEQHILDPTTKLSLANEPTTSANRLILPSKMKHKKPLKKKTNSTLDDFLQTEEISKIIETHALFEQKSTDRKGKSKMIEPAEDFDDLDFEQASINRKEKSKMIEPTVDLDLDFEQASINKNENSKLTEPMEDLDFDFEQESIDRKEKSKMIEVVEDFDLNFEQNEQNEQNSSWERMLSDSMFDRPIIEGEDEFGDLSIDASFMEKADALLPKAAPFDDSLEPLFPFETQTIPKQDKIQFIWAQEIPKFSEKGMIELEKRQQQFKASTGRFLTMKFFSQYSNTDDNDDDVFEIDFNDDTFTDFLENKMSQDQDFPAFLFDQESQRQQSRHIMNKSSLYADKPKRQASPQQQDKPTKQHGPQQEPIEEVFEIDFDDESFSEDSVIVQEGSSKLTAHVISDSSDEEHKAIIENLDDPAIPKKPNTHSEDEYGSPVSLASLSKGLYTPSPLRSENEASPLFLRRRIRKRPLIEEEEDSSMLAEPTMKRLKQKIDRNTLAVSNNRFLEKLKQCQEENPFIDDEAEKSDDEGHTDEEEQEGSSLLNSFIDDNSSVDPSSRISHENGDHIYKQALSDSQPYNNRHWMNRFNADKWLNVNQEDDHEVITEEEEEEESIQDFSSAIGNMIDDDDFM